MHRHRVIPTLLLRGRGLVKTHRFKDPKYVGDPINAIRIFNEKEVDELIFLDIEATRAGRAPDLEILSDIAAECFMPLCYGGGVNRPGMIDAILRAGVEKVAMNSALFENPSAVSQAVRDHASSTIVASIDYRRSMLGRTQVYVRGGSVATGKSPVEAAKVAEGLGVGEIMLNCIDRDGTLQGYDLATLRAVSDAVSVPVI
ncbi:MAG: imidazole glycerol phosphate synthase subunit HisF, partial [Gemmatimonadetes bacterium]|nr:imidazole glycerol phosphate synthase subunit HisF [Gemmatimonadota bacterium]